MNINPRKRHELKDAVFEMRLFFNRAVMAFILVFFAFVLLLYRAYNLQVTHYKDFATRSDRNRISLVPEAPVRGIIYDRNGVILADNRSVYSLELIPEKVKNMTQELAQLKHLLQIPDEKIEDFNKRLKGTRRFKKIILLSNISEAQRAIFEVNRHLFSGASIEARLVRYYPFGKEMVHVLGFVGRINENELTQLDEKNYKATRNLGKVGLEKYYEPVLHGKVGYREVETDVHGRVIRVLKRTPPVPGANLILSIDSQLQLLATKALGNYRGSIVALDPQNGEVLTLVSNPGYDPNAFVGGISSKAFNKLLASQDRPLFNRSLLGQYPPGSTIKPMLGLAGLEYGIINKTSKIDDPGWFMIENEERKFRDWTLAKFGRGHGKVDLYKAIVQSCDTFFYDLSYRMGIDKIHEAMNRFGFGELTGIDMGEEKKALMPSREWKRAKLREPWFPGETVIVGIGQGFWTVTPLQLANATAILANRGTRFDLRLVTAIDYGQEKVEISPKLAEKQVVSSKENMDLVLKAMQAVNKTGTARTAFRTAKFTSAGKTGTAQLISIAQGEKYDKEKVNYRERDNAMYIAFAPFENPEIALSIVVENEGHGGSSAAPIARKIIEYWLKENKTDG